VENNTGGAGAAFGNIGINQLLLETAFSSDTLVISSINTSMDDKVDSAAFYVLLNDGRFIRAVQNSRDLDFAAAVGPEVDDNVLADNLKAFNVEYLSDGGADVHNAGAGVFAWTSTLPLADGDEYDGGNWNNGITGGDFNVWPQLPTAIRVTLRWNDETDDPDDNFNDDDILFNHIIYVPAARKISY
jgi:hypothetical protein